MKTNLKVFSFTTLLFMTISPAHAYKFVIYTDEAVTNKSEQVAELMKKTYPLSKFDVEVEIVRVSAEELNCESSLGIDRLVTCKDSDNIQAKAMRRGGDQAMIVKNMSKWGGSSSVGGGVPVITSGTSARAMLHEYMHTLGLCDEYEYKAEEAGFYCNMEQSKPNMVFINPQPSYADDSSARLKHGLQIPWYNDILTSTPITSAGGTRLGTGPVDYKKQEPKNETRDPQVLGEPTGLYQGKVCNQAKPNPRVSWHPGGSANIMENVEAGLGAPLERVVEKILVSKGVRKKMQVSEEAPEREIKISNEEPGGKVTVSPKAEPEINDTGRGFFKSFFAWIKDLFQSLRNAMPR